VVELVDLLRAQDSVLSLHQAEAFLGVSAVRWRVSSGRWQRPWPGVVVAHSGPLTERQRLWADVVRAGHGAVVGGATALVLDGLRRVHPGPTCLVLPHGRQVTGALLSNGRPAGPGLRVHSSRVLSADVQTTASPPRTRTGRSAVDAARWAVSESQARLLLVASVQQRLVSAGEILRVVRRLGNVRRRRLIERTCADLAGGAHTLAEIDFARLCRRHRLPTVSRQVERRDSSGRRRWLDACFDEYGVVVEIDGAGHLDVAQWWDDLARSNDLAVSAECVLRFPSWQVRDRPDQVLTVVARALRARGWRG
jgi:very-short-patch-repair endonuclease